MVCPAPSGRPRGPAADARDGVPGTPWAAPCQAAARLLRCAPALRVTRRRPWRRGWRRPEGYFRPSLARHATGSAGSRAGGNGCPWLRGVTLSVMENRSDRRALSLSNHIGLRGRTLVQVGARGFRRGQGAIRLPHKGRIYACIRRLLRAATHRCKAGQTIYVVARSTLVLAATMSSQMQPVHEHATR